MRSLSPLIVLSTILLAATSTAAATQLASATWSGGVGTSSSEAITEIYFEPTYYNEFFLPEVSVSLGRSFSEVDVGGTWALDNFADYAAKLTHGSEQFLGLRSFFGSGGGGSLVPESVYWTFSGGISGPDLSGYLITGIDFTLDALTFLKPGSDPNGDGNWNEAHFTTTLAVHGKAVPESDPFAISILFGGVVALAWFRSGRVVRVASVCQGR